MRKKYLSALLFGALLFASAGTFTSCKDYDDDINNLQEQINTINTTLTELKGQVGATGVSSVTFDEATGVLTVVDGKGTTTYKINTIAESMVEAEIKDGILSINGEEIGAVVGEVTVEGGKLMVDGKEVATLGGESQVVSLVKNEDNQTYTLTVGNETVVLPLNASAASVAITFQLNKPTFGFEYDFSGSKTDGFNYGVASEAVADWAGPKGAVAKGDFLVGQINSVAVAVNPYNYDFTGKKLTLVDTEGNVAPVEVVATPAVITEDGEPATDNSRAASASGKWNLSISMKESVTEETITKDFAYEGKSLLYALAVDGNVVSSYDLAIKPEQDDLTTTDLSTSNTDFSSDVTGTTIKVGKNTVVLSNKYVYDSYLTFEGVNEDKAKEYGVEADGMTLTLKDAKAAGADDLVATLYVLTVDGRVDKETVDITIESSTIDTPAETTTSEYTISADANGFKTIYINAEDVFTYADVKNLSGGRLTNVTASVVSSNYEDFIYKTSGNNHDLTLSTATLMVADKDGKPVAFDETKNTAADIKWVELVMDDNSLVSSNAYVSTAKEGTYKIQLVVKDTDNNETVKFTSDLKVSFPSIDTFLTKSAVWTDATNLKLQLGADGTVSMFSAYSLNEGASDDNLKFVFDAIEINETATSFLVNNYESATSVDNSTKVATVSAGTSANIKLSTAVQKKADDDSNTNKLVNAGTFTAVYNVRGIDVKSEKATISFNSAIEGAQLVYLKFADNKVSEVTPSMALGEATKDFSFLNAKLTAAGEGFAIKYNGEYYYFSGSSNTEATVNGVTISIAQTSQTDNWKMEVANKNVTGNDATVALTSGTNKLEVRGIPATQTPFDVELKLTFKKAGTVGEGTTADIYYEFPVTINRK